MHTATRKSRHTTPQSGIVIQALTALDKGNITEDTIRQIAGTLAPATRKALEKDLPYATAWNRAAIRKIITAYDHGQHSQPTAAATPGNH